MLVYSNTSSTPTPCSSMSTTNTLEPVSTSTNSSTSQLHQQHQQSSSSSSSLIQPQQKQQQMSSTSALNIRPPSCAPSILDSPTLARVERATLRLKDSLQYQQSFISCGSITTTQNGDSLERVILDTNKVTGRIPVSSMLGPIKRGILWQQRDRIFSRWKERYFVLTRDYLHCFKRASGSANERASDMGQFIFKVKLVDVEKVEWLNRRSYSAIALTLGREGRVLLRCGEGLEDWFELLEECTITSKERRRALKFAQGPRSRASLAAPISHASLQSNHFGLGGTYLSALDNWRMTDGKVFGGSRSEKFITNSVCGYGRTNPFLFSDSVPDLSAINNENNNNIGISTNHSTPQKIPCSSNINNSRYSSRYEPHNSSYLNGNCLHGSPRRICINNSFGSTHIVDEEAEDAEVELRRPRIFRHLSTENGNEPDKDWLYRKPKAPTDFRYSAQLILPISKNKQSFNKQISYGAKDSGFDIPPSTHRPSSCEQFQFNNHNPSPAIDSTENTASSSRGTVFNYPGCISKTNLNQENAYRETKPGAKESILKLRNKQDICTAINSAKHLYQNGSLYDANQNRYNKSSNQSPVLITSKYTPHKKHQLHPLHNLSISIHSNNNASNDNNNNNSLPNGSAIFPDKHQHPALKAILNEVQSINYRDRSYSDCMLLPSRKDLNNSLSPASSRKNQFKPVYGTQTRV